MEARELENLKVVFTNGIPICPDCKVPTIRTSLMSASTAMYFPPTYDENGVNTNPDRNSTTTGYTCSGCLGSFAISGNAIDGYNYI